MPYLIDSHCHLHDPEFYSSEQQKALLEDAARKQVNQIICIGTSDIDSRNAKEFAEAHNDIFWTYGIHPEAAGANISDLAATFHGILDERLVGIGEVGLDYHYTSYDKSAQWHLLEQMLDLAVSADLPCSFHVRDALCDFFAIIENFPGLKTSVLHSFTDSKSNFEMAINKGFYIGLNGIATFANLDCYQDANPEVLQHIILETDAPFLTPEPKRGKINKPGNIAHIASWLSKKIGVSVEEVAEKTSENVRKIFNLPNPEGICCADSRKPSV